MDREKVIAGLMMLIDRKNDDTCEGLKCCKIAEDALALLKEQEAVEPVRDEHDDFCCGRCGKRILDLLDAFAQHFGIYKAEQDDE